MTEYVACKHCGDLTRMLGTRECDRCHELWLRIRIDPELASKALEEFTQHQRDRIQAVQEYDAEQAKPKLTRGVTVPRLLTGKEAAALSVANTEEHGDNPFSEWKLIQAVQRKFCAVNGLPEPGRNAGVEGPDHG